MKEVESNTGFKKIYEKNETNKDEETIKYDLQEDLVNFLMEKVYFIDYTKTEESKKLANLPTMVDKSYELFINKCFNDTYHLFGNKVDNNVTENGEISDAMGLTKAEDIELSTYLVLKDMYDKFLQGKYHADWKQFKSQRWRDVHRNWMHYMPMWLQKIWHRIKGKR